MNIKLRIKIIIPSFLLVMFNLPAFRCCLVSAQVSDYINHPLVRTVLIHRSGWDLSMPVIRLDEEETLDFRFDYLDDPAGDFSYAIDHCTFDWHISDLSEHEYLEGFNDYPLYNYEPSRNTTQYYTHFYSRLPNEDLAITRSGNYRLRVYENDNPDSIIISRRFAVLDEKVDIQAQVRMPDYENQEISLIINLKNLPFTDPAEEIKLVIIKNYNWDHIIGIRSGPFLRDNRLHFDMPGQIVAKGGNEFRQVDTKDTRFVSGGVEEIVYRAPHYTYIMKPEHIRQYDPYFSNTDLNGRSFYEIPDAQDPHLDADYVRVIFRLESQQSPDSDVYVYGALTDWKANDFSSMNYLPGKGYYEKELLLKQGLLNYAYVMKGYDDEGYNFDITEGNHSETENDYLIFVYYRDKTSDYDELVGYKVVNSRGRSD